MESGHPTDTSIVLQGALLFALLGTGVWLLCGIGARSRGAGSRY